MVVGVGGEGGHFHGPLTCAEIDCQRAYLLTENTHNYLAHGISLALARRKEEFAFLLLFCLAKGGKREKQGRKDREVYKDFPRAILASVVISPRSRFNYSKRQSSLGGYR